MRHSPQWLEVYEHHTAITCRFYNHFKLKHVRIVRTPFLMRHIFLKGAACCKENDLVFKNLTDTFNQIGLSLHSMPPWLFDYILCVQYLISNKEVYKWLSYVDAIICIFCVYIFNFSIQFIWLNAIYIIPNFVTPYCYSTVPLVKHCVITNGPIYGFSYLYAVCLVRLMLSLTLYLW